MAVSREVFLEHVAEDFGADMKEALAKLKSRQMHMTLSGTMGYATTTGYHAKQHEIESKEWKQEQSILLNDLVTLYAVSGDQCNPSLNNNIQSNQDLKNVYERSDMIGLLLGIINKICLSNDTSKY